MSVFILFIYGYLRMIYFFDNFLHLFVYLGLGYTFLYATVLSAESR